MEFQTPLDNGKYVITHSDNRTTVTRNGEEWRDLTGDNLFFFLLMSHTELEQEIAALKEKL